MEKEKSHKFKKAEKSLRILVADDAELNRELIIELLKKRGHVAEGVADGRQALAALEKHSFDVVLLDEEMPGMTGLQTTAAIRRSEATTGKHQIIIGISGHATDDDEHRFPRSRNGLISRQTRRPQDAVQRRRISGAESASDCRARPQPEAERVAGAVSSTTPRTSANSTPDSAANSPADSEDVVTHLRRTTGGNEKLIRSLAATFLVDAPKALARIRTAVAKKNATELASAAHLLKGSLAIFGAPKAVAAARNLEALGRADNVRETSAALRTLESEFALVQQELRAIHSSLRTKIKSRPKPKAARKHKRAH